MSKLAAMCDFITTVTVGLLALSLQFNLSAGGLQLVPARRITCSRNQPDINNLFCIILKTGSPTDQGDSTDVIEVCKDKEPNILSTPEASLVRPFLTKSSGGDLSIDVFFLDCPCPVTFSGRSLCPDPPASAHNFTCEYFHTVNNSPRNVAKSANVSHVNMTSMACCDTDLCTSSSSSSNMGGAGGASGGTSSKVVDTDTTDGGSEDPTHTVLIALLACFGLVIVAMGIACVCLWRKCQRLLTAAKRQADVSSGIATESDPLSGNDGYTRQDRESKV